MKLAGCYTIFNGLELLQNSIDQIRDLTDEIIICWQKTSNKGNVSNEIEQFVKEFQGKNRVHLVFFEPNLLVNTKQNERVKHQLMIDAAKKLECTHFFMSATDHFYRKSEFEEAKKICFDLDYDVTFTKMFTYYKHSTWQLDPIENYLMPFICKLYPETYIGRGRTFPYNKIIVDPSVQVFPCRNWHEFDQEEIMLHHLSMVRENIKDKFLNAAASIRWPNGMAQKFYEEYESYDIEANPGVKYFQGRKIKVVPNYFLGNIAFT